MTKVFNLALSLIFIFSCICNGNPVLEVKTYPMKGQLEGLEKEVLDFRYQPAKGQCCIGWPDDFYKTIVASDSSFCYQFNPANWVNENFDISLKASIVSDKDVDEFTQSLLDPKVAIVKTTTSVDRIKLTQIAFASAVTGEKASGWIDTRADYLYLKMENTASEEKAAQIVLNMKSNLGWKLSDDGTRIVDASAQDKVFCTISPACLKVEYPKETNSDFIVDTIPEIQHLNLADDKKYDQRFSDFMVGWNRPMVFKYKCQPGKKYKVAFGLVENFYSQPKYRKQDYRIDGTTVLSVDAAEYGQAIPVVKSFEATDTDGDGMIDIGVYSAEGTSDLNTVLSCIFIFAADDSPTDQQILEGKYENKPLAILDKNYLLWNRDIKIYFDEKQLKPGQNFEALITFLNGKKSAGAVVSQASKLLEDSIKCWKRSDIPYGNIKVPDVQIQGLLDSCIRNIYQAREIKNDKPAFQVGPTFYRGTWAADGPFILEAVSYMGRLAEARQGLENQIDGDNGPAKEGFSKKHGLRLWMVWRHAQLTDDMVWLEKMWPKVEREVNTIKNYRQLTKQNPNVVNYGLMPDEYGDGGLDGKHKDYTSVYWTMAGLKAAIEMAEKMNKPAVEDWKAEYADYWKCFEIARNRDKLTDEFGNTYVPVVLKGEEQQLPQRGAWAFMQSIYPGRVFDKDDELMLGTVAMLDSHQKEGLICGTGWLPAGIWNDAASFYGHVHLWLGHGKKTAATFYAFANHASPLLCWREEQNLVGQKFNMCGDMPHNWASGEFIRMARHMIMLERGNELHFFEGLPIAWTKPGDKTVLKDIPTTFGKAGVELEMSKNGKFANVIITVPDRENLEKVVLHLEQFNRKVKSVAEGWSDIKDEAVEISPAKKITLKIEFE